MKNILENLKKLYDKFNESHKKLNLSFGIILITFILGFLLEVSYNIGLTDIEFIKLSLGASLFEESVKLLVIGIVLSVFIRQGKINLDNKFSWLLSMALITGFVFAIYESLTTYPGEHWITLAKRVAAHPTFTVLGFSVFALIKRQKLATISWILCAGAIHAYHNFLSPNIHTQFDLIRIGILLSSALVILSWYKIKKELH